MLADGQTIPMAFSLAGGFWSVVMLGIVALAFCYFIFSLIALRQVNLMTEMLITEAGGLLRAFAIIHAGLALGVVILFIGFLL